MLGCWSSGGPIGSATVSLLSGFHPRALHVVDLSENYLAELVRNLRGRPEGLAVEDFRTLPLDYGSPLMRAFPGLGRALRHCPQLRGLEACALREGCLLLLQTSTPMW